MEKLKPLIVPQNTLELKDFSEFCKIHTNYVDTAEFYKQQLNQRKEETNEYGLKILFEHFLKPYEDWKSILNKKDLKIISKLCRENFEHNWFFRCLKTNKYFLIDSRVFYNYRQYDKLAILADEFLSHLKNNFKIKDNKIILNFYYPGISFKATCYSQGKSYSYTEIFTIDLLDYSVTYEHKENISYSSWEPFKSSRY